VAAFDAVQAVGSSDASSPAMRVEHRGEPWALLIGSVNDEPIAMEATVGKKTAFGPGGLMLAAR
jgi:hypothetical protein